MADRDRTGGALVDGAAVVRGALVATATCLPLALVGQQVVDADDGSSLGPLLFVGVLVGLAIGGFVAARRAADAPFTNGGVAALLAYVAIQGVAVVVRLVDGDPPSAARLVFTALLAFACGLAGGALAGRTAARGGR
jgi:putative membrane protein (TIGR04086 family)